MPFVYFLQNSLNCMFVVSTFQVSNGTKNVHKKRRLIGQWAKVFPKELDSGWELQVSRKFAPFKAQMCKSLKKGTKNEAHLNEEAFVDLKKLKFTGITGCALK